MKTDKAKEWTAGVDEFAQRLHINVWVVGLCVIYLFGFHLVLTTVSNVCRPAICVTFAMRVQNRKQREKPDLHTHGEINLSDWQETQLC